METRDEDPVDEAPPGWVLRTPTRWREVWDIPVLALVLAALSVVVGVAFGDGLAFVAGIVTGAVCASGAVVLFVVARRAYEEQTRGASWDLHRGRIVVGVTIGAVVMVASLVVGLPLGTSIGIIAGFSQTARFARTVPRFDLATVASAFLAVVAACAVLVVLGVLQQPVLPAWRAAMWVDGGIVFALLAAVLALVHAQRAARAPLE